MTSFTNFEEKTALVTWANSGLGFEAAAQLAEAGYGRVILACRSAEKADQAKALLFERTGRDCFDTLTIDVSSIASAEAAAAELIDKNKLIDTLLLNAGIVSGKEMRKSVDGIEMTFAASLIGHHLLMMRLLNAGLLADGVRIVMVGSSLGNNDAPKIMGASVYDFAFGNPTEFDADLATAMMAFAKGQNPSAYHSQRYYATTKLFSSWWSGALNRRYGDRVSAFTVGPGPNMGTNVGRNQSGFMKFLMSTIMPIVGSLIGVNQPISEGAKRYLDVLHDVGQEFKPGKTYTSPPKTPVGPLTEVEYPHVNDVERQEIAWTMLNNLVRLEDPETNQPI